MQHKVNFAITSQDIYFFHSLRVRAVEHVIKYVLLLGTWSLKLLK